MILKASQRGGAVALGKHLLNSVDNEHVELHQVRGFIADDVMSAMREAYAVSKGTKCRQHLFSVSLSPPETENVGVQVFEGAIEKIEERNGLSGQPRIVIFHEKEGRRHAHAVWSRIDAAEMKAVNLPFFKMKLRDISKSLFLENGWQMPKGLMDSKARDPLNYSLAEYQQAKRIGINPRELKSAIQDCYAVSDGQASFKAALKERGLHLANGRRGFVAVPVEKPDEIISISRAAGKKAKEVRAKLGDSKGLHSVDETKIDIAKALTPQYQRLMSEAHQKSARDIAPMEQKRQLMKAHHTYERQKLDSAQQQRWIQDTKIRSARLNSGLSGLWQALSGKRKAIQKQNEMEAFQALERDRQQRQNLIHAQLQDRHRLQFQIRGVRQRHTKLMVQIYKDVSANKERLEQTKTQIMQQEKKKSAVRIKPKLPDLKPAQTTKPIPQQKLSPAECLQNLRNRKAHVRPRRDKGPGFDHEH